MAYYIVQVMHTRPGSPVCTGERVGEFETEEEALSFISVAVRTRRYGECEFLIRKKAPLAMDARMAAAA